jgi:FkbM family methyltransferase
MNRGPTKRSSLGVLLERKIPVRTILDVGALHGTPDLMEAYPDRTHVLFEPVAEFREKIERGYANIPHKLVQAAVSDRSGTTTLKTVTILAGFAISHSHMTDEPPQGNDRTVPMVTLDHYLASNPVEGPFLLKVDIDGADMKVLRGATEVLKQTSIVMIEVVHLNMIERLSFLFDRRFRLFDLTEPCYYDDAFWQCDAILIREDYFSECFADIDVGFDQRKYHHFLG